MSRALSRFLGFEVNPRKCQKKKKEKKEKENRKKGLAVLMCLMLVLVLPSGVQLYLALPPQPHIPVRRACASIRNRPLPVGHLDPHIAHIQVLFNPLHSIPFPLPFFTFLLTSTLGSIGTVLDKEFLSSS